MKAIYKREVKAYFTSMLGYAVIAFFLAILGYYFWGVNLYGKNPSVGYTLSNIMFVYTIILPLLTMRLIAEEQKQKSDQLLFSAPISVWSIVVGKFLAVITIFSVPFVAICSMPLVLSRYGKVGFVQEYLTIFAFWLMGVVFLAIGLMVSSLTENQIVAAIISFAVNITIFMMSSIAGSLPSTALPSLIGLMIIAVILAIFLFIYIKNIIVAGGFLVLAEVALVVTYSIKAALFESALSKVLSGISFMSRYQEMTKGTFNLDSIFYYISFIFLFLYLTVQSIQKRRWS